MTSTSYDRRAVVYQVFVRHWGNPNAASTFAGTIEQNGCGKLSALNNDAIRHIASLGVTHVWLTGVLRHATLTAYTELGLEADDPDIVKGRAGSPYAIKDYYDVDPDLADDPAHRHRELDALIERLHVAGLRVLLDLVPNHVARSYAGTVFPEHDFGAKDDKRVFFASTNDFFYLVEPRGQRLTIQAPKGWNPPGLDGLFPLEDGGPGRVPRATGNNVTGVRLGPGDWYETVKLNYGFDFTSGATKYDPPPSVWWKMDAIVAYWQGRGVDGFRCDFSHWVPVEFWRFLIARARSRNPASLFHRRGVRRRSRPSTSRLAAQHAPRNTHLGGRVRCGVRSPRVRRHPSHRIGSGVGKRHRSRPTLG
ncbi:MAG: alpha-amylase family glycosyl hydrolase [Polyangiaceae bacterium]